MLMIVAGLAVVDGSIWRSGWFVHQFPGVDPQVSPRHGQRLAMMATLRPKIAFIGNSRTLQGLRPVLFDRLTGGRRQTVNLAISGAPVVVWHLFVRRLAALPVSSRPKALVIGITATDLLETANQTEPPDLYGLLDWPRDAMPGEVGWATSLDWGLGSVWHLWRNRAICRKIIEDRLRLTWRSGQDSRAVSASAAEDRPDPMWLDEAAHGFQPTFARSPLTMATPRPWPQGQPLPQVPWLHRITATSHAAGMAVYGVVLPQYGRATPDALHRAMMGELRTLPLDGLTDYAAIPLRSPDWQDNEHLSPAGATVLARRMATDLQPWVRHAVP